MRPLRAIAGTLIAVPLLAFGPGERAVPTRWALIVGVSDYLNYQDVEGGDLPGAARDAQAMRDVLVGRWDFPEGNVRMLLDGEATREGIREGITSWLMGNVQPGDNVVFFFAGHGAQVWDENGDEEDGLDETIAPADVDPSSPEFDITDDELGEWLRALPSGNVVYIHDNCNAGTGTRDVTPFARARKLARNVDALPRPAGASTRRALPGQEDESGFDLDDVEVLELAASQPDQAAIDAYFPGEGGTEPFHGGAFTTFLIQQLWRAPANVTYEDVFRTVAETLEQNRFQQDPHLSESVTMKSAPLFFVEGGTGTARAAALPILGVAGDRVELGAGAAFGLTDGSVVETEGGAQVLLERVERDRATGRRLAGNPAVGQRARVSGFRFPRTVLRVAAGGVGSEILAALRGQLEAGSGVELAEGEGEFSHLLLRRRGTELRLIGQDGFPRSERPFPAEVSAAAELARHLTREASALRLADMENVAPGFGVTLTMANGRTSYGLGEKVAFEATSERDGYLTLVDLGTDGTVTVLFPNEFDRENRVRGGAPFRFPTAAMGFEIEVQPPAGRGMVRLFVTPEPLDLPLVEGFFQGRTDAAEVVAAALERAVGTIPGAPGAVQLDGWATTTLVYDVTR